MATAKAPIQRGLSVEDPFDIAFPIAIDAAQRFCAGRGDPHDLCYTYHCLWPRLRRIGCAGSAWIHADTYMTAYRRCARSGGRRILVAGAADYSLTGFLIHAFRDAGVEPDITVLDQCEAPLVVNRWYADRHQCRIKTVAGDVLDFQDESGFDLITTDNFFTRFQPDQRRRVVGKWRELLRPAGAVVTAQRISDADSGAPLVAESRPKIRRIRAQAERHANTLDIPVQQLIDDAARYYDQRVFVPITSVDEIVGLFAEHGLQVEAVCDAPPHDPDCPRTGGLSRSTRHVAFVAGMQAGVSATDEQTTTHSNRRDP